MVKEDITNKLLECVLDYLESNGENLKSVRLRLDIYYRDKDDRKTYIKNRKHLSNLFAPEKEPEDASLNKMKKILNNEEIGY